MPIAEQSVPMMPRITAVKPITNPPGLFIIVKPSLLHNFKIHNGNMGKWQIGKGKNPVLICLDNKVGGTII